MNTKLLQQILEELRIANSHLEKLAYGLATPEQRMTAGDSYMSRFHGEICNYSFQGVICKQPAERGSNHRCAAHRGM